MTGEWEPLAEMVALSGAASLDEFHRRLVLFPPLERNRADAFEPVCLFRHYHESDKTNAESTAFLLVTDERWRNATGRIMEAIATSGLVRPEDLDLLAQSFLAAGRCLYWRAPDEWFDRSFDIVLDRTEGELTGDVDIDDATTMGDQPVMIMREIRPPLRRWAAAHLVRRDPAAWTSVLQRCGDLDARSAAAVMRGLLDAIDSLSEPAQSLLRRRAANWPQRDVRAAAEVLQLQGEKSGREPQPTRCTAANYKTEQSAHHHGEAAQQERLF